MVIWSLSCVKLCYFGTSCKVGSKICTIYRTWTGFLDVLLLLLLAVVIFFAETGMMSCFGCELETVLVIWRGFLIAEQVLQRAKIFLLFV